MPRLGGGQVNMSVKILNQDDQVVMKGNWGLLVHQKPDTAE